MVDATAESDRRYCERELREYDHDRYLASLLVSGNARRAVTALYAFNVEIARTREVVSEALLGEMRLQFWRETIDEIFRGDGVRQHPVAQELAWATSEYHLARELMDRLLVQRHRDLCDEQPTSLADLERYTEATSAGLLELAIGTAGPVNDTVAKVAHDIGISFGLSGLIRALPFHARQRRLYLPIDLLDQAEIDREAVFAGHSSTALIGVVKAVADRARAHLNDARQSWPAVPSAQRSVLVLGSLVALDLRRLQAVGHNPFDPNIGTLPLRRLLRLIGARLTGRF